MNSYESQPDNLTINKTENKLKHLECCPKLYIHKQRVQRNQQHES